MCLGIPGQIIAMAEPVGGLEMGVVEFDGLRRSVCLACVPDAGPGDYVLVHAGIAISQIDPAEAHQTFADLSLIREQDLGPAS